MLPITTLFDVDAGLLDDELLAEQMRLLTGLISQDRSAGVNPRMPALWQGHEDALALRLNQLMTEMVLRGKAIPGYVAVTPESLLWPALDPRSLAAQLEVIGDRAGAGKPGRIRVPRNDHELWATYKYSVLARNTRAYQNFGQRVASRSLPLEMLWASMINATRVAPSPGGIRNALQHMWGYVSGHASVNPQTDDLAGLANHIQALAAEHQVSYLLNSTALAELRVWL